MHGVKASCTIRKKQYALIFCILAITLCALATSTGQLRLLWEYHFHPSARFAASLRNKPFPQQQQQQGFDMSVMLQLLRPVVQTVPGMKLSEGAGIQIRRTVGTAMLRNLDPFLMLDELKLPAHQATAGFPDHPHRGFETCTIVLEGEMQHEDSAGNKGVIGPGGVQWMTAGRGIIHSEMPLSHEGRLWGFQLWINLPKQYKMMKPRYQDYQSSDIPSVQGPGSQVRVMAGQLQGVTGPISMKNPGLLMDVVLEPGAQVTLPVPQGWQSFAYVYDGAGDISGTAVQMQHALVFGDGDHVKATAAAAAAAALAQQQESTTAAGGGRSPTAGDNNAQQGHGSTASSAATGLKFLLMAGVPIKEPIVQHGPFVMNTQEEIMQAFMDYQAGTLQNPNDNVWAVDEDTELR